jgi:AraC-like DNA-binding protein
LYLFSAEMKSINEQLRNISNLTEGKSIVETFLLKHVSRLKPLLPFDSALQVLLNNNEVISIEKMASLSCLSIKQFERKCKERIGMNPKLYTRIFKFSKAYRLREAFPQLTWTNIAHTAGYYDQMHMIKDFKLFAGVNPSVIEKQLQSTPLRMQKDLYY